MDEPPGSCIRTNGDIAPPGSTIEQELPLPGFVVQEVADPGPSPLRSRNMEPNVMNPVNPTPGVVASRSLMVPTELLVRVNGVIPLVTAVGLPAARQLFEAPPFGSQSMAVIVTMTPPPTPEQFAIDNVPIVAAEADGANVAQASTAKLKTTNFSEYCFFNVFLRKVKGHYLRLWVTLGTRISTLKQLVNESMCAEWTLQYRYAPLGCLTTHSVAYKWYEK